MALKMAMVIISTTGTEIGQAQSVLMLICAAIITYYLLTTVSVAPDDCQLIFDANSPIAHKADNFLKHIIVSHCADSTNCSASASCVMSRKHQDP